jgi:phosphotransferase system HPr-like phosphotransfer protein
MALMGMGVKQGETVTIKAQSKKKIIEQQPDTIPFF